MLDTIPVELQSHILGFLPRRDLAIVLRVSKHAQEIAIRILYAHVKLRSLGHVESFFAVASTVLNSSAALTRRAEVRRSQWDSIRTLDIHLEYQHVKRALGNLPRSLRGRGSNPLRLDRLRVSYYWDELNSIIALLRCFDPAHVSLCQEFNYPLTDARSVIKSSGLAYPRAASATLVCYNWQPLPISEVGIRTRVGMLVSICPNLERMQLVPWPDDIKPLVEQTVQQGLAGKAATFFSIQDKPAESNSWGDVVEDQ